MLQRTPEWFAARLRSPGHRRCARPLPCHSRGISGALPPPLPARALSPTARTHQPSVFCNNSAADQTGCIGSRNHRQRHWRARHAHPRLAAEYNPNTAGISGRPSASICSVSIDARRRRRRHAGPPSIRKGIQALPCSSTIQITRWLQSRAMGEQSAPEVKHCFP